MIIEGEFFSNDHLRWNLGWPTPNYAGAFLAAVIAITFGRSGWRWAFCLFELGGLFLLAKTYSRGAVVAWGAAWLFGALASRGWRESRGRMIWGARLVAITVMMLLVDFEWSRPTETLDLGRSPSATEHQINVKKAGAKLAGGSSATEDASIVNRLILWKGGLRMLAAAPLTGWGAGESGHAYVNWFQETDRREGYTTLVNSYLHVAVEHGLITLTAAVFGFTWLMMVAWWGARNESMSPASRLLQMAMGASLVAWATANFFTTLWIDPKLWIVPAVAASCLGWNAWEQGCPRSLTSTSLMIAILIVSCLYGAGRCLLSNQPSSVSPGAHGSVVISSLRSAADIWNVWPDAAVLGPTPGKELRRWLNAGSENVTLIAHRSAPLHPGETWARMQKIMLFGRQAERLRSALAPECTELWLIHPLGAPPLARWIAAERVVVTVLLPEIDESGNGDAWRQWANATGARIIVSPSTGLDIRAAWPEVMRNGLGLVMKLP